MPAVYCGHVVSCAEAQAKVTPSGCGPEPQANCDPNRHRHLGSEEASSGFTKQSYGPGASPLYGSGGERKVPGHHGMSYTEEDWVDDEAT